MSERKSVTREDLARALQATGIFDRGLGSFDSADPIFDALPDPIFDALPATPPASDPSGTNPPYALAHMNDATPPASETTNSAEVSRGLVTTPPASETADAAGIERMTFGPGCGPFDHPVSCQCPYPLIAAERDRVAAIRAEPRVLDIQEVVAAMADPLIGPTVDQLLGRAESDERLAALDAEIARRRSPDYQWFGKPNHNQTPQTRAGIAAARGMQRGELTGLVLARGILSDAAPEDADTRASLLHPDPS